jgi:hypothetical protein
MVAGKKGKITLPLLQYIMGRKILRKARKREIQNLH